MELYEKQNNFADVFAGFLKSRLNFEHFEKKDEPHTFCISGITDSEYAANKCLRSPVLEQPSTSNMVNGIKQCSSLRQRTFIIFIDNCETNLVGESLSY